MDYDDYQVATAPSWLSGANGKLWNQVLGIVKNAITVATRAAVMQRFADYATPSTLVTLLEDRGLDPAWRENETSVRSRVKKAWDTWSKAETKLGMGEALVAAGFTAYEIREQPQDPTLQWFEFDLVVLPPFPYHDRYKDDGNWGEAGIYDDGGSYSYAVPPEFLSRLRLIAKKKGSHARCRWIIVRHLGTGEAWDDTAPPGEWDDDPSAVWTDDTSYIAP